MGKHTERGRRVVCWSFAVEAVTVGRGCAVVIVDADEDASRSLADYLSVEGIAVCTSSNAVEGLGLIRDERPRLVFIEIDMPGWANGCRLAELATNLDHRTKVILMSRNVDALRLADADRRHGAFAVLDKPLPLEHVRRFVESVLATDDMDESKYM